MNKITYVLIIFLFISSCTLNKVSKTHGSRNLDLKEKKISINISNKNDVIKLLGPPSTKSYFDNDIWMYIEKENSSSRIRNLGKTKLLKNNVLLLKFDNRGIINDKLFLTKEDLKIVKFDESLTISDVNKKSVIADVFGTIRQKIDDPLGKKRKTLNSQ